MKNNELISVALLSPVRNVQNYKIIIFFPRKIRKYATLFSDQQQAEFFMEGIGSTRER